MGMESTAAGGGAMKEVAIGQRLMIFAILVNIVAYVVSSQVHPTIGLVIGLVGLVMAVTGVIRATTGLGFSAPRKVFYVIGLFIPIISLIVLAMVSAEATKALRANGYEVGFFGAKTS